MSDAGGTEETTDYSKMKVSDLKKLLKSRGLPFGGVKTELIERLQSSETEAPSEDLLDGSEVGDELVGDEELERELDESSLLTGDDIEKPETKEEPPEKVKPETTEEPVSTTPAVGAPAAAETPDAKPSEEKPATTDETKPAELPNTTEPPKRKISLKSENSPVSNETAKKKLRAERFGAAAEENGKKEDVLAKRAERFAINSTTKSTTSTDKSKITTNDLLKKRAERFGILSPAEQKKQQLEKLQARKLRFASSGSAAATGATPALTTTATATIAAVPALPAGVKPNQLSIEERKKLRAMRFNNVTK